MKNKFEIPQELENSTFHDLVNYVYQTCTEEFISEVINNELINYTSNPFHNYSRLSSEFPFLKSELINVAIQHRPKDLQQNKTLINTLPMDISFKVLSGKMEIITYQRKDDSLINIKQFTLNKGDHVIFEREKDIVEFHPIKGEDSLLLVCQGPIKSHQTECFDIITKKQTRKFSTQTKESRLRLYSQALIETNTHKQNKLLEKVFSQAKTSELRWSILKSLKDNDTTLMRRLLDLVPKDDQFYNTSLKLRGVINNVHY